LNTEREGEVIPGKKNLTSGTHLAGREGRGRGAGPVRNSSGWLGPGHGPGWAGLFFSFFFSGFFFFLILISVFGFEIGKFV
jgi:hypothetical protein